MTRGPHMDLSLSLFDSWALGPFSLTQIPGRSKAQAAHVAAAFMYK